MSATRVRRGVRLGACFIAVVLAMSAARAQEAALPVYDVSTVKPHGDANGGSWGYTPDGFQAKGTTLKDLIAMAWGMRQDQIAGDPRWAVDDSWDVTAKVTDVDPVAMKALKPKDRQRMMQALLAERFQLKAHLETREGPEFNLLPAKGGVKLKALPPAESSPAVVNGLGPGSVRMMMGSSRTVEARAISVAALTNIVAGEMRQTVVDKTGLPARDLFDITLHWTPDDLSARASNADEATPPPLRDALEQELGLHLEGTHGPLPTLVIDHVERPAAN